MDTVFHDWPAEADRRCCLCLQVRKELADGCADAVQQAQRLAAATQSDLVNRLQQQDSSTQEALSKQQAEQAALKQQLQDQANALTKQQRDQQEALAQQQRQQVAALQQQEEQQAGKLAAATTQLQKDLDEKLSELELLLTGRVNDTSAGKTALTDAKLAEIRWASAGANDVVSVAACSLSLLRVGVHTARCCLMASGGWCVWQH